MATPPKKTASATKAPAKSEAKEKAASKPTAKTSAKSSAKAKPTAASRTDTKPKTKAAPKATPKAAAKTAVPAKGKAASAAKPAATTPASVAAAKKAAAPATAAQRTSAPKPAAKPSAKPSEKPALKKDTMTAEERERSRKLKATLALLKADPEWPDFLREQREALLALRDELAPSVHSVTRDHLRSGDSNLSSSSGQHIGDAGSDAEVRALTIRLLDKDREQLFEIDAALERIRRGTYGICEISLDPIPKGRLRVRPFCRLTVKCQEEYEKKYGSYANYRAKNQDSVGFAGLQNDEDNAISLDDGEE